jgi:3-hydroxyisobutyrate dehydrogenase
MRITCIGVGNMGGAVARRLAAGDFDVTVHDPSPDAMERCVAAGAAAADSLESAVANADLILTSLPTPELVVSTISAVLDVVDIDAVVMDISTIDPQTARTVADRSAAAGVPFVACPLGKTPAHAEEGTIPLFVGGAADALVRIRDVLDWMGEKTYHFETVEAATTFKLVSNFVGMANVAILAEGLAIASRAGIDDAAFSEALADTGATSFQSEVRLPWMVSRDWTPRFGVDLAAKDVRLAVASAALWKIPTPVGSAALAQLMSAATEGWGGQDVVALAKLVDAQRREPVPSPVDQTGHE